MIYGTFNFIFANLREILLIRNVNQLALLSDMENLVDISESKILIYGEKRYYVKSIFYLLIQ